MRANSMRCPVLFLMISLAGVSASADVYWKTRSASGGENANQQIAMVADGYAKGLLAQVYIRESSNPIMKPGTYLYTDDGGKKIYLVNPENETVSEIDLAGVMKFAGNVLESLGPVVKFEISDPEVKVISEGPGPSKHGLTTKEYTIDSRYAMKVGVIGIKRSQEVHEVSRILTTNDLNEIAAGMWFRKDAPQIGNEQFDKLSNNAFSQTEGTVVDLRVDSTVISKKGKEQRSWSEFELLAIDQSAGGPPDGYGYPNHYTPVALMPTADMTGEQQPEEEEKKGRFGRLFKKKDGG